MPKPLQGLFFAMHVPHNHMHSMHRSMLVSVCANTYTQLYVHTHTYIYIYIYTLVLTRAFNARDYVEQALRNIGLEVALA